MICTELTRENLMLFPHVLFKLFKLGENFRLWTATAYRRQKIPDDTHGIHFCPASWSLTEYLMTGITTEQQYCCNSALWIPASGQPHVCCGAFLAAIIVVQTTFAWAPQTPVLMISNSAALLTSTSDTRGLTSSTKKMYFFVRFLLSILIFSGQGYWMNILRRNILLTTTFSCRIYQDPLSHLVRMAIYWITDKWDPLYIYKISEPVLRLYETTTQTTNPIYNKSCVLVLYMRLDDTILKNRWGKKLPVLGIYLLITKVDVVLLLTAKLLSRQTWEGLQLFHKHHLRTKRN